MGAIAKDVSAFLSADRGKLRAPIPTASIGLDAFPRDGIPVSVATSLADRYGLARHAFGALLRVRPSTLDRRFGKRGKFVGAEAYALYRHARHAWCRDARTEDGRARPTANHATPCAQ